MDIAGYTAIADVGDTLLHLLREHMVPDIIPQPELIGLGSPADDKNDMALTLYLYLVKESGEIRRNEMVPKGTTKMQFPPVSLDLYYLVTAHSKSEAHVRHLDEHRILGKVIQIFYDNSILRGPQLRGSLAETNEEVRIVMNDLSLDIAIQFFPDMPYKLSLSYAVGPVYIDSTRIRTTRRVLESEVRVEELRYDGRG